MNWLDYALGRPDPLTELQAKLHQTKVDFHAETARADAAQNRASRLEALLKTKTTDLEYWQEKHRETLGTLLRVADERNQAREGYAAVVESFERKIEQLKAGRDAARLERNEALECMATRAKLVLAIMNGERDDLAAAHDIAQQVRPDVQRHEYWGTTSAGETGVLLDIPANDKDWVDAAIASGLAKLSPGPFGVQAMTTLDGTLLFMTKEEAEAHLG